MTQQMPTALPETQNAPALEDFELGPVSLLSMLAACAWPGITIMGCWLFFVLSWEVYDRVGMNEPLWTWFLYWNGASILVFALGLYAFDSGKKGEEEAPSAIMEVVITAISGVVVQGISVAVVGVVLFGITDIVYDATFALIIPALAVATFFGNFMAMGVVEEGHPWLAAHKTFFTGLYLSMFMVLTVLAYVGFAAYFAVVVAPPELAGGASMVETLSAYASMGRLVLTEYIMSHPISLGVCSVATLALVLWGWWESR